MEQKNKIKEMITFVEYIKKMGKYQKETNRYVTKFTKMMILVIGILLTLIFTLIWNGFAFDRGLFCMLIFLGHVILWALMLYRTIDNFNKFKYRRMEQMTFYMDKCFRYIKN
jgi:hypothetical protein